MNIIPLYKEEQPPKRKVDNKQFEIPFGYWQSSYSNNFYKTSKHPNYRIIKSKTTKFQITAKWDISKGDYRVKDISSNTKDFVYYRDLKIKFLKYSIYPVIVITILLVLKFSEVLSKI